MLDSLKGAGCRILSHSPPNRAPFCITFESPTGDRIGVVAYAFLANRKLTQNRPTDEHRFQLGNDNSIWERQANWCVGRRCKSSAAKEQVTPRRSASRARVIVRWAVKRR